MDVADFVVVGAGSAGCAVAGRLSAATNSTVALLEAGTAARNPLVALPPSTLVTIRRPNRWNWGFVSEPEEGLYGRRVACPRGRGVGGTTLINASMYVRGHPEDYDEWARLGCPGWRFEDVLPYFRRSEDFEGGESDRHGAGGPLRVQRGRSRSPVIEAFVEAGRQAGYPVTDDFNNATPLGFGRLHFTIRDGRRCTAARAFLDPARQRANLAIITRAHASRVLFEGRRAVGVEYRRGDTVRTIRARREVVLSAGAIQTPQLLMLSGIGDPSALRAFGIALVHESPEVGRNLQDHFGPSVQHLCAQPVTLYRLFRPHRMALALAQALILRSGPAAHFPADGSAFVHGRAGEGRPDLQFFFIDSLSGKLDSKVPTGHGYSLRVCLLRPEGRGEIRLASASPAEAPRLVFNYLAAPRDLETLAAGVAIARRVLAQPAFDAWRGAEVSPAPGSRPTRNSTNGSGATPTPSIIRPARHGWAATRRPWSIRSCASGGSAASGSRTPRSCRASSAATPTPPAS
jgi:choline dehydrogenase